VHGDATALGQVFSNLIGNAIKYRSPHRPLKVEIGGKVEDGTVHYWVRDNGLGIPEAGKARLFQVFQRLHPQAASGEGMGLAIAHRIVGRHQGKVWAESREGEGSTFHFSLPLNPRSTTNVEKGAEEHGTH
jgi:signal transduction histidine kinase